MNPETLKQYLELAKEYGILHNLIDKLITPENIKAIVSGAVEGSVAGAMKERK